ncbi:MAG TPA: hypothetical protein VF598_02245 [Hymenobacter sp.]|jgi:hypothetical protein
MLYYQLLVDTPSLALSFDAKSQWLYAEWKGEHDTASIVAGCAAIRQCLAKTSCRKVLADSSQAVISWDEAAEWLGKNYFEVIARQGVRYLAWVCSSDLESHAWAKLALQHARQPTIALFYETTSADVWLRAQA